MLRQFYDPETVTAWRESFYDHIREHYPDFDQADTSTWPNDFVIPGGFSVPVGDQPQMKAVAEQLGGGGLQGGGGGTLVVWPQDGKVEDWQPGQGHIDGCELHASRTISPPPHPLLTNALRRWAGRLVRGPDPAGGHLPCRCRARRRRSSDLAALSPRRPQIL